METLRKVVEAGRLLEQTLKDGGRCVGVAYSMELSTCWVGVFNEEEVKKALSIPDGIRPVVMISVGHGSGNQPKHPRSPLNEILHYEIFYWLEIQTRRN